MRKRIVLHGYLRDLWNGPAEFEAESAAEAIRAFCMQTKALNPIPGQGRHRIRAIGFDTVEELMAPTDVEEIHLIPQFAGGKKGGFVQILLGAALVAAAFLGPASITAAPLYGELTVGALMFSMGAGLILGGLAAMMAPKPNQDMTEGPDPSKYLGAPKNTVAIGTRIPFGYGRHQVYGHYLFFDIDAKDVPI